VDDFEVTDLRVLTLGDKVTAVGNVLRALPEACLFREGNSSFAVFVDDGRRVLVKPNFDAEFEKKETFLCGRLRLTISAPAAFRNCRGVLVERQGWRRR
jgi:hypothetical protein